MSVRFTHDELKTISDAAQAEHSTISEYLRGRVSRAALGAQPGARWIRTQSGAELVIWTNAPELVAVS